MSTEHEWEINLVKERYEWLQLTWQQAQQVFAFETDNQSRPYKLFFSDWEEWDYEGAFFKRVLNDTQYAAWQQWAEGAKKAQEQSLVENDAKQQDQLAYWKELVEYYDTTFHPPFFHVSRAAYLLFHDEQNKISYIKQEYKKFLNDLKWETTITHFRHSKQLQPNTLELNLLRVELARILPDYWAFKQDADEATKGIIEHLKQRYQRALTPAEELFEQQVERAHEFAAQLTRKYYPERETGGWHVTIGPPTEAEQKESNLISSLLIDKNKYK